MTQEAVRETVGVIVRVLSKPFSASRILYAKQNKNLRGMRECADYVAIFKNGKFQEFEKVEQDYKEVKMKGLFQQS